VALLDYVAGDYGLNVQGGAIVSPAEYDEQLRFVSEAGGMAAALAPDDALLALIREAEARVRAKADPASIAAACRAARDAAVARFGLRTTPSGRPSLTQAQALYAQNCAVCHGPNGDADTERAALLNPPPARFRDPKRLAELSPYRVYNDLTFGVAGTAMASFESLSPEERWSLAFYVFRLGHQGEPLRGPVALPLAEMASRSDRELLAALRAESHPDPAAGLAYLRHEEPFRAAPAGAGVDRTRQLLRQAMATFGAGRAAEADRFVLDAYLQGFEPLEPALRARDSAGTQDVEAAFRDLRVALQHGTRAEVLARADGLETQLSRVAEGRRPAVPFAAAFLIFFREGIEAALLVGALLAGLRRLGRPEAARWIHAGWLGALPAGVATWWTFDRLIALGADKRELLEGVVALAAAGVLFSVSFWMISKAESRHWMAYLRKNLEVGVGARNLALLSGLAFLAVYREAAETILFTQALLLEAGAARGQVWAGAGAGLLAMGAAAVLMARTVVRLPLGLFFGVSSLLLCGLAISFAGSGIYVLVAAGYLTPRPVRFPEVPWMGIHPDLTGLLVQLTIVLVIAAAGLLVLRRAAAAPAPKDR
jgi:high-affinity iron transporter